jgi:hypothetical protein
MKGSVFFSSRSSAPRLIKPKELDHLWKSASSSPEPVETFGLEEKLF